VLTVRLPGYPQRYGDTVLVLPQPVDPQPEEPDEDWMPTYPYLTDIFTGDYAGYPIAGVYPEPEPEPERVGRLVDLMREMDCGMWHYTAEEETVVLPGEDVEVPGIYAMLAVPAGREAAVNAALLELTGEKFWNLAWPELAEAAGSPDLALKHTQLRQLLQGEVDGEN